jgi:cytoskeletal protein CcmA (bactofilin family)
MQEVKQTAGKGETVPENKNVDAMKTATVLAQDVEIKGTIVFETSLTVKGTLDGEIISEGNLVISPTAKVTATIRTKDYTSLGKVTGDVTAAEQITLKKGSVHTGNLATSNIDIEPGAVFNGSLSMNTRK